MIDRKQPLLDLYKERLEAQAADGSTKDTASFLGAANRLFEACILSLEPQVLDGLGQMWFGESYAHTIDDLKKLASSRGRRLRPSKLTPKEGEIPKKGVRGPRKVKG